eukprot:TRINITY_DN21106_c0_g1::TRINITY_DN21106_c0_g1_i1::g.23326::m.23326 TRINITY_DN21106_c0_g1::TRINITY_DN21106_c0_g1_i1::g.23326  ORF type:complete len:144 (-),score=-6.13,sp/Q9P0N5/TM216_HUMAN/37.23/6e-20,Transmemb_17/PF09799.4/2.4e-27,YMF19/PF02326.10/29,YMF19/PF02326.10/11 TRINITY_DN21106_c0_g1_i1:62-493(-)
MAEGARILSSAPLQILIYFNGWYSPIYFILTLLMLIYKGNKFTYPSQPYGFEVAFIVIYVFIEYARLVIGSRGNRLEAVSSMLWFLLLSGPILFLHFYFLLMQTYVLRLDEVLGAIGVFFVGLQCLLGTFVMMTFRRGAGHIA